MQVLWINLYVVHMIFVVAIWAALGSFPFFFSYFWGGAGSFWAACNQGDNLPMTVTLLVSETVTVGLVAVTAPMVTLASVTHR